MRRMKRQKQKRMMEGEGWSFKPAADDAPAGNSGGERLIKLRMERRRGKPTTVLYEMSGVPDLKEMARSLRQLLSAGGTIKDGTIELQGEHRERLRVYLQERGYQVKG